MRNSYNDMPGCPAFICMVKPNQFSFAVFAGEAAAVPKDCSSEQISFSDSVSVPDEPMMDDGEKDEEESLDSHKMIRVCDTLIEVFMVDKSTPTDWRRLLDFSKEWNNICPYFYIYKHCQDRADSEDDPGMNHKFRWLGRLKEVRHII